MKNIIKYISALIVFALALLACEDQLTKAPLDAPSDVTFFQSRGDLEVAINGVYNSLWWQIRGIPALQEIDNATDIGFLRDGPMDPFSRGAHDTDTAVFLQTWTHFYSGIARANNLLEKMERARGNVDEDFFVSIQAQARFLRAFFYHFLTELYGDVPLLTEVPIVEEAQIGQSPKSEVVSLIMSDLEFAAENLPITWSGSNVGRITKGAALSLIARVALYNQDFGVSASAAQEVMDLGIYSLHPNYEEQFQYGGIGSSEVILDTPFSQGVQTSGYPIRAGERMTGSWSTNVPSQALVDSYQASDGLHIDESAVYDPANPFANRDPRLDASLIRPQSTFAGYVFETHPDSLQTWNIVTNSRVANLNVTNPFATFTGIIWRKYLSEEDFPASRQASEINWIYLRYAEVLLTYAEAKIELNDIDQSVLDAMNKVRARAYGVGISETDSYPAFTTFDQNELRREVRYERKIELANEGFRLFDMRRWGIANVVMSGTLIGRPVGAYESIPAPPRINRDVGHHPDYSEYQDLYRHVEQRSFNPNRDWLWPIPQSEININENIIQNPGY